MKREALEYYLDLDYRIIVQKETLDNEIWYIAYCDELGKYACYGQGDTREEAISSFIVEKDDFIESLYSNKKVILEPINENNSIVSSGIFNVRATPQMHSLLISQAAKEGVSLNKYVNTLLSYNAGLYNASLFVNDRLNDIERKLDKHHSFVTDKLNYRFASNLEEITPKSSEVLQYTEEGEYFYNIKKAS